MTYEEPPLSADPLSQQSLTFEEALTALKNRARVARKSWTVYDPGSYICCQEGYPTGIEINANTARATGMNEGTVVRFRPYLMVRLTDGTMMPWLPSMLDLFATDWYALEG
jgi:hypothetical protein